MKPKRLLAGLLCLCLLIPFAAPLSVAAAESDYIKHTLKMSFGDEATVSAGTNLFSNAEVFKTTPVDLAAMGYNENKLALQLDLKLESDNSAFNAALKSNAAGILAGWIEFTSSGKCDKNEAALNANRIRWSEEGGWTRMVLDIGPDATMSHTGGDFDPANWNYFRFYLKITDSTYNGSNLTYALCNVRIVDKTKTAPSVTDDPIGNDPATPAEPTDPEGYVLADLPLQVSTAAVLAKGADLFSQYITLSPAIDLQSYIDAGCAVGLSFDVFLGGDDDAMDYVLNGAVSSSVELTSSGKCDNSEINTSTKSLGFKKNTWVRTVLPLSRFSNSVPGATGSFDNSNWNYMRIYMLSTDAAYDNLSVQVSITNIQLVDMNKKAPSTAERPIGDGSFTAEAPQYFEVKTPAGYENSEIVVAGYNARDYVKTVMKQDPDKVENWSPILQSLANGMAAVGGGVVYLPAGHYPCTSAINLPSGVTLYGDWANPDKIAAIGGTVLAVYYGRDSADTNAFITMANSAKLQNLAFWYPEQNNPGDIIPYAPTVSTNHYTRVDNVTLVNSYTGIVNKSNYNCPSMSHIYGTPLNAGLDIGMVVDLCRAYEIHFSASYWENSALTDAPASAEAKTVLEKHLRDRATGIIFRRVDWSYVNFSHIKGYNIGMAMLSSTYVSNGENKTSYINGQIYGNLFEDCAIALYCEGTSDQGEAIVDTEIRGCDYGVWITDGNTDRGQNMQLNGVTIDASVATVYQESPMITALEGCTLSGGAVQLAGGILTATNCTFLMDGPQILAQSGAISLTLAGNKDKSGGPITVDNPIHLPITQSDAAVSTVPAVTLTADEAASQSKKPAGTTVKVATGLDNTGKTDVTAALQAQLDSLKESGGLLYLPGGTYRLDGSITVPSGVELKGALAVGRVPYKVGTILDVYGGRDDEDATATVILKENAGIRGIVFNWPEQYNDRAFHTYPYAIQGQGAGVYIIHTSLRNAWRGVDLFTYRCDNHYVEYLSGMALDGGLHVGGGSQNGVLIDCHFNYNAMYAPAVYGWGKSTLPEGLSNADWEDAFQNQIQHNAAAYRFGDVDNQLVYGCMTYSGAAGLQFVAENGNAASVRVFCQSVDYGNVSIDVQAAEKLDIVSAQVTSFNQLPTGWLKNEAHHIRLGADNTATVNVRSLAAWATSENMAIDVQSGTLNVFGLVVHRTGKPLIRMGEKGVLNAVSFLAKESSVTNLIADGNAKNVSIQVGVVFKTPTDSDKLGKYEGVITRQTRWDVPDSTNAFGENSQLLFSEGFTDYGNLSEEAKIFRQKNMSGMSSGSVARSGRMTLTVVAQEAAALILTDTMAIPQGKTDSLYRLESRLNLSSMRAGSSIALSAFNNENDILNLAVFNADGTLTTYGKKSVGTFETNKWYRLAIELDLRDTANKTLQVYLYDDEYKLVGCSAVIALPSGFQGEYQLSRLQWGVENQNLSSDAAETDDTVLILDYVLATYAAETTFGTLGDVDGDGDITSTDARLALQFYAGKIAADKLNTAMGDVDGDGEVTSTDARLILQRYVGKISKFPAE